MPDPPAVNRSGWDVVLRDGRRFCWDSQDGIRSASEARERTLAQEPNAEIGSVEEVKILSSVDLGRDTYGPT